MPFAYCPLCGRRFDELPDGERCPGCGGEITRWADQLTEVWSSTNYDGISQLCDWTGQRVATYDVESLLGEGGMARVYLARHLTLERPCALKVLKADCGDEDISDFLAEARMAANLIHPNIVRLHTIGEQESHPFLELEYVDGGSVADRLAAHGPISVVEATQVMLQVGSALQAAHRQEISHRDIKPSNVLVTSDGRVKLGDFGLARPVRKSQSGRSRRFVSGTPQYMAPELFRGAAASYQSDVYSVGITYHVLLTGAPPFAFSKLSELTQFHRKPWRWEPGRLVDEIGELPCRFIARCLAYDPGDRYAHADQLHGALRALYGSIRSLESLLEEALPNHHYQVETQDRLAITVPLPDSRKQRVFVQHVHNAALVDDLIQIFSVCGRAAAEHYQRALELNARIPFGSIGIKRVGGEPWFVMTDSYPRATCDPEELRRSVLAIAKHADQLEQILTGQDQY